ALDGPRPAVADEHVAESVRVSWNERADVAVEHHESVISGDRPRNPQEPNLLVSGSVGQPLHHTGLTISEEHIRTMVCVADDDVVDVGLEHHIATIVRDESGGIVVRIEG